MSDAYGRLAEIRDRWMPTTRDGVTVRVTDLDEVLRAYFDLVVLAAERLAEIKRLRAELSDERQRLAAMSALAADRYEEIKRLRADSGDGPYYKALYEEAKADNAELRAELARKDDLLLTMTKHGEADDAEIERLRAEIKRERMRHAACGVVAQANTRERAEYTRRLILPEYRSPSVLAVEFAVDSEMQYREQVEALRAELDAYKETVDRLHHALHRHGLHPGRTDEDIIDIVDAKLAELAQRGGETKHG